MISYLLRRLAFMVPTVLGITLMVFMLLALAPGGIGAGLAVSGGQMSDTSKVAQMQAYLEDRYGLNDPVIVQYARWLGRISPVKFGERDLRTPSGERVAPPRAIEDPPLLAEFPPAGDEAGEGAGAGAAAVPYVPPSGEQLVPEFKRLQREAEGARRDYIGSVRRFRDALADWARAQGPAMASRLDAKGAARASDFEGVGFAPASPGYGPLAEAAATMHARWRTATATRERALAAFRAGPYPKSGIPLLPGLVSLDTPDLGVAFSKNRPVADLIAAALPVTLLINLIAFPISYLIAVPTGILASVRRGGWFDVGSGFLFLGLYSVPTVLAGVFAIGFLANRQYLGWFPVSGLHDSAAASMTFLPRTDAAGLWHRGYLLDTAWHVALPVLCLVYASFAVLSKQTRASMLDNFSADYVRTAKAKGVPRKDVVMRHVFRNSLLPLITMFVGVFPAMLAGSVVIERIFTVPGMGSLILEAIDLRDREIILANTFMVACVNLLALLLADVLYAAADPRVSFNRA
jgi:ABC-type dipeptide/oligopeptide/nickel transport system permease component